MSAQKNKELEKTGNAGHNRTHSAEKTVNEGDRYMTSAGRIFSGVQPTGNLHLGNYLGAIKNWVDLQTDFDCIYCVVDLHAITVPQEPDNLRRSIREVTACLIASGIDPSRSVLFNQSRVPQHAELAWVFNCCLLYTSDAADE